MMNSQLTRSLNTQMTLIMTMMGLGLTEREYITGSELYPVKRLSNLHPMNILADYFNIKFRFYGPKLFIFPRP